jgi:hypothetical protein
LGGRKTNFRRQAVLSFKEWMYHKDQTFVIHWSFKDHEELGSPTSTYISKESTVAKAKKDFRNYMKNTYGPHVQFKIFSISKLDHENKLEISPDF